MADGTNAQIKHSERSYLSCASQCKEFDDSTGEIVHYISTPRIDYVRDVMNPFGVDHRPLDKNRAVFFNHRWCDAKGLPIGKNVWVKSTRSGILAKTKFAINESAFAADVYRLTKAGYLNSWSIGFFPSKVYNLTVEELPAHLTAHNIDIDIPNLGEFASNTQIAFHQEWVLFEYSKVSLPMNMDALDIEKNMIAKALNEGIVSSEFGKTYFGGLVTTMNPQIPIIGQDAKEEQKAEAQNDDRSMVVQTLIFSKERFATAEKAQEWAREHGFKADKVDETEDSFRIRQRDPADFDPESFRTIELDNGVKAVVGKLKKQSDESSVSRKLDMIIDMLLAMQDSINASSNLLVHTADEKEREDTTQPDESGSAHDIKETSFDVLELMRRIARDTGGGK